MQEATADIEGAHTVQMNDESVCRWMYVFLALALIILHCVLFFRKLRKSAEPIQTMPQAPSEALHNRTGTDSSAGLLALVHHLQVVLGGVETTRSQRTHKDRTRFRRTHDDCLVEIRLGQGARGRLASSPNITSSTKMMSSF